VNNRRGVTLIEVVVVMAIIAISIGLAGPRIGAGLGTLELRQSEQNVKNYMKFARIQARRADRDCYLVLDNARRSIGIVDADLKLLREQQLPASVSFVFQTGTQSATLNVAPSGIIRGNPVRLHGRTGEVEVSLR
jgi:prepilin-type N-terminal cleavage/methylation domain-containing protein